MCLYKICKLKNIFLKIKEDFITKRLNKKKSLRYNAKSHQKIF